MKALVVTIALFVLQVSPTGAILPPDAPMAGLTADTWRGSLFFMDCSFAFTLKDACQGVMHLGDEFGVTTDSMISILAPDRFIDSDNQTFTIVPTATGFDLISTHLPPIHLRPGPPYESAVVRREAHFWSAVLLSLGMAFAAIIHDPDSSRRPGHGIIRAC
ncbi:hypothetical protein JW905_01070 [bacterium]|nr:hypothetical protein [candidate division CSSED10-310 bacterium]